jgi:WD40 repeat protein
VISRAVLCFSIYLWSCIVAQSDAGIDSTYMRSDNNSLAGELLNLVVPPGTFRKSFALVVGVGKYQSFPQLDAPASDAFRVRNFLRDEAGFDYIVTLTDEKATRERIESLMEDTFPSMLGKNDRFLFYFSGHGKTRSLAAGSRGYLVLSNSVNGQWDTMIDMPRVSEWAQNVDNAKHTLFLIDACFSGLAAFQAKGGAEKMTLERLLRPAHHLITAGVEGEESYSIGGKSIFTSAFIAAAQGQVENTSSSLVSLDDIMVGINRYIDGKRAELGDISMTPHLYQTKIVDNSGEFFFVHRTPPTVGADANDSDAKRFAAPPQSKSAAADAQTTIATQTESVPGRNSILVRTLDARIGAVQALAFSPDGRLLAVGGASGRVQLRSAATGELLHTLIGHSPTVASVAFSPDSRTLISAGMDHVVRSWDVADGGLVGQVNRGNRWIWSVAFSRNGRTIAAASDDGTISLWSAGGDQVSRTLTGHTSGVLSAAFSPSGLTLASGSWDKTIKLWNLQSGSPIRTLIGHTAPVWSVAFSANGELLASGGFDATIRLWDPRSGQLIRILNGHSSEVRSVAFSPDGRMLASGSEDYSVKLWDVRGGTELRTLSGHVDKVITVAFSPDGRTLVSGGNDGTIRMWDISAEYEALR